MLSEGWRKNGALLLMARRSAAAHQMIKKTPVKISERSLSSAELRSKNASVMVRIRGPHKSPAVGGERGVRGRGHEKVDLRTRASACDWALPMGTRMASREAVKAGMHKGRRARRRWKIKGVCIVERKKEKRGENEKIPPQVGRDGSKAKATIEDIKGSIKAEGTATENHGQKCQVAKRRPWRAKQLA